MCMRSTDLRRGKSKLWCITFWNGERSSPSTFIEPNLKMRRHQILEDPEKLCVDRLTGTRKREVALPPENTPSQTYATMD